MEPYFIEARNVSVGDRIVVSHNNSQSVLTVDAITILQKVSNDISVGTCRKTDHIVLSGKIFTGNKINEYIKKNKKLASELGFFVRKEFSFNDFVILLNG